RVARLFSLLRFARGIGKLLLSLMMSLPVLFNVGVLLLVLVVASSIFAMFNFAYVRKAYTIDDMFNFETFWSSFICLIMTTMTASWGGLLMALTNTPPDCDPFEEHPGSTVTGDCGSPMLAIIFFCTHVALSLLLIVHLYVAVILKILEPDNGTPLSDDQLQMFYEIWRRFDLEGSQSIQYR
ncbi:sodium channel protein type 4 subunit alpha B-like, partial [Plectropomus leopardus]|uniref:sodium channel protein type 4 subunit alpha B-like n=1 Tax=Plectropomus leopardus TaxID=160734 RepID=UPI001C4CFABF